MPNQEPAIRRRTWWACPVIALLLLGAIVFAPPGVAAQNQDLYRVTLLRATPGRLPALIAEAKRYKSTVDDQLVIMRHSQGDHWDLMLLGPTGRDQLATTDFGDLADFQHDFLARSNTGWTSVHRSAEGADLFHIEMFQAAATKRDELLREREMENAYLAGTGRNPNVIFETVLGSDTDVFTVGFYESMVSFATDPDLPDSAYQKAAAEAGFKSRADIGFYLRQFIVGHQDTLASNVR